MSFRRWSITTLLGIVLSVLAVPGPVAADPPGPTEYRTSIIDIEPAAPGIELEIIGGDSFVHVTVAEGTVVEVVGYEAEPYIRIEADGTVRVNQNSPSRWYNEDRFGDAEAPPGASADADPAWTVESTDGRYAWHDHRAHWMNSARPPGAEPGDVVLEWVVPFVVDGVDVDVLVQSRLLAAPSRWPLAFGAVAAVAASGASLAVRRPVLAPLAAALAASAIGAANYLDVPAATGPSLHLWLLPTVAALCSLAALALARRSRSLAGDTLLAFAGIELVLWAVVRRLALTRPIIPSPAPGFDRSAIVAAGMIGVVSIVVAFAGVLRPGHRSG